MSDIDDFWACMRSARRILRDYVNEGSPLVEKLVCIFCGERQPSLPALAEHFAARHGAVVAS